MTAAARQWFRPAALAAWMLVAAAALAQDGDPQLAACAAIDSNTERLACYDRQLRPGPAPTAELEPAHPDGTEERGQPAATIAAEPERSSGASKRDRRRASRSVERAAGDVEVRIVTMQENVSGLLVLQTEDGQVLEQISTLDVSLPEPPFAARLSPARSGTYFLSADDRARIRVRRRD